MKKVIILLAATLTFFVSTESFAASCPSGYTRSGNYCVPQCPSGYHRSGAYCKKN